MSKAKKQKRSEIPVVSTSEFITCSRPFCNRTVSRASGHKQCDECREINRRYYNTEKGSFKSMLRDMKKHSVDLKKRGVTGTCTITRDQLLDIYIEQGRRCAISDMPLTHRRKHS